MTTEPAWVAARDLVAGLPAGLRRRVSRPIRRPPPTSTGCAAIVEWFDHAIELGASGIALGPMFASRTHGYDTTDHYRIDPRLGDDADFDHLIAEARRRGLRVLLDGVFNHVGTDFAHTRRGSASGATSFDTFEGHGELIALDHDNPEVVDYTVDVMTHWLRPRRRRLAPGRRLRRPRPVLGAGTPPGARSSSRRLVRRRGHPRRLLGARARRAASTRSRSTNCGRRSGAASTTATSTSSTGRWCGTTSSSTTSCR